MVFVKNNDELRNAVEKEADEIIIIEEFVNEIKSIAELRYLTKEELEKLFAYENIIMIALGITPIAVCLQAFGNSREKVVEIIKKILPQYLNAFMEVFDVVGITTFDLLKKYEIIELQFGTDGYIRLKPRG